MRAAEPNAAGHLAWAATALWVVHPLREEGGLLAVHLRPVVKALVRLHAGQAPSDALARDLQMFVKTRLAAYKYPREIEFVTAMPLTSSGKIRRGELRRLEYERKGVALPGAGRR